MVKPNIGKLIFANFPMLSVTCAHVIPIRDITIFTIAISAPLCNNEVHSAVLLIHGDKAHSCCFSCDAYADMVHDSKYADNKELMLIPGAVHTNLYDGGGKGVIPFDRIQSFFAEYLR